MLVCFDVSILFVHWHQADPNIVDGKGKTCLHHAAQACALEDGFNIHPPHAQFHVHTHIEYNAVSC